MNNSQATSEVLADLTRMVERLLALGVQNELLVDPSWIVRTITKNLITQGEGSQTLLEPLLDLEYGDWDGR